MWREWLMFPKALLSGAVAATLMWIGIIGFEWWRSIARARAAGLIGLGATSGGWNALLHSPLVLLLLTIAFGAGLFYASR